MRIRIEGLNQIRLLNRLKAEGIRLQQLERSSQSEMTIGVAKKDSKKAIAILQNLCYNYVADEMADNSLASRLKRRLAVIIAIVLSISAAFSANLFVWGYDIIGVSGSMQLTIQAVCAQYAPMLTPKSSVDIPSLRDEVLALPTIASVDISFAGNVLSVSVLQSQSSTPHLSSKKHLLSGYDAVITRIITERGTPLVKCGDVVRRGDRLISGDILSSDGVTVIGNSGVVGSVYGNVTFSQLFYPPEVGSFARTGRESHSTSVGIFGLEWEGEGSPYQLYESSTQISYIQLLGIRVTTTTYYELNATEGGGELERFIFEKCELLTTMYGGAEFSAKSSLNGGVLRVYFTGEICIGRT